MSRYRAHGSYFCVIHICNLNPINCWDSIVLLYIFLQTCVQNEAAITPYLLAIEKIFTELLKTREMVTNIKPSKIKGMMMSAGVSHSNQWILKCSCLSICIRWLRWDSTPWSTSEALRNHLEANFEWHAKSGWSWKYTIVGDGNALTMHRSKVSKKSRFKINTFDGQASKHHHTNAFNETIKQSFIC